MSSSKLSKFRSLKCTENHNNLYNELHIADIINSTMNIICNHHYIAINYGNLSTFTNIQLLPIEYSKYKKEKPFVIQAHGDNLGDMRFSPYTNVLVTGSKDGYIKLWSLPENGKLAEQDINKAVGSWNVESGGITNIKFHPSANNILACTTSKNNVALIDLESGKIASNYNLGENTSALSCAWNTNGSRLSCISKDGTFNLIDPRNPSISHSKCNGNFKPSDIFNFTPTTQYSSYNDSEQWLMIGDSEQWLMIGSNSLRQSAYMVIDGKKLSNSNSYGGSDLLYSEALDGVSSGVLLPLYDADAQVLYVSNRGSTSLNVFDTSPAAVGQRMVKVDTLLTKTNVSGLAMLPKYAANFDAGEVGRIFKLNASGSFGSVSTIHATVERRLKKFHEDLFPDTVSNKPVLSASDYLSGKDSVPFLLTPDPEKKLFGRSENVDIQLEEKIKKIEIEEKKVEEKKQDIVRILESKSESRVKIDEQLKQKKFRILTGKEPLVQSLNEYCYQLQSAIASVNLNRNLAINSKFFVTPWKSLGGSAMLVWPLNKLGRMVDSPACLRGHSSAITCFSLTEGKLATGAADAHVMIWDVEQVPQSDVTKPALDLRVEGKVTSLTFHPFAKDVLAGADFALDTATLYLWNLATGEQKFSMGGQNEAIMDIQFSLDGNLIATSSKDGKIRIIDPRKSVIINSWSAIECGKDCSLFFASDNKLIAVGSGQGRRSASCYDITTGKLIGTYPLDSGNAAPLPSFDVDQGLLFVATVGERIISVIQFDIETGTFEFLTTFQSAELITALAMNSKLTLDVKNAVIDSFWALTKRETLLPISFRMPRKRLEYFQDDLYSTTRDDSKFIVSSSEWFGGSTKVQLLVSLQPSDLPLLLSQAPPEELSQRQMAAVKAKQQMEADIKEKVMIDAKVAKNGLGLKSQDEVIDHFRGLQNQGYVPKSSRWDAKPDAKQEVADDEWD